MQGAKNSRVLDPTKFLKITKVGLQAESLSGDLRQNPMVVRKLTWVGAIGEASRIVAKITLGPSLKFEGFPLKPSFWSKAGLQGPMGALPLLLSPGLLLGKE